MSSGIFVPAPFYTLNNAALEYKMYKKVRHRYPKMNPLLLRRSLFVV